MLGVAKQAVSTEEAKRDYTDYDVYHKSPKGLAAKRMIPPAGAHLSKSGSATKILSKTKAGRMRAKHFGSLNTSTG